MLLRALVKALNARQQRGLKKNSLNIRWDCQEDLALEIETESISNAGKILS